MPMQGRMRPHRLHARALRLRESVIARLLLTLVLALGAVGTFQYFVVGERVESDLIREHAAVHAADARSLEQRAEETEGNRYEQPLSEVTELMAAIQARPDTLDVVVTERDGTVLASPVAGQVGIERADPLLRKVARTGRPLEGVAAGAGRNAYIVPLRLLDRDLVFAEYRSSDALKSGVASFRDSLGMFVLLSLLIALPLFYLLGGRRVGVLYRAALQRSRDGLTDLDNHRAFQDEFARAVGEATRYDASVTLALLDIDDFKFENDRHGHQHGDRLLCELADLLREQRAGDRAFRLGGDAIRAAATGVPNIAPTVPETASPIQVCAATDGMRRIPSSTTSDPFKAMIGFSGPRLTPPASIKTRAAARPGSARPGSGSDTRPVVAGSSQA